MIATLPDVIVLKLGKERLLDRMRMLVRASMTNWKEAASASGARAVIQHTPWMHRLTQFGLACGVAGCQAARMGRCQPDQAEARITRQKFSGWNEGSLSASTSALTVPKVVSGLCCIPS